MKRVFFFLLALFGGLLVFDKQVLDCRTIPLQGELKPEYCTSLPILTRNEKLLLRVDVPANAPGLVDPAILSGNALFSGKRGMVPPVEKEGKIKVAPGTGITRKLEVPLAWFQSPAPGFKLLLPKAMIGWSSPCLHIQEKEFMYLDVDILRARVRLETNLGNMEFVFEPEKAPDHVKNFLRLVKAGFYDGTLFHRVIRGFMIQGGDPNTKDGDPSNDGRGGAPWTIDAEFNCLGHTYGTLSMARSMDPDSASSQFFIVCSRREQVHLNCKYTAFGKLISGEDTLDRIASVDTTGPQHSRPRTPVVIKKAEIFYPE